MPYQHTTFGVLVDGDVTRVPLWNREKRVVAYAIIDTVDAAWVTQWRWHLSSGYAARAESYVSRQIWLHREILGLPRKRDGLEGDHINRNKLDNRRGNLRVVPSLYNQQNKSAYGAGSQYRGVCWSSQDQRWTASVKLNGRLHKLGYFLTEWDAAGVAAHYRVAHMPGTIEDSALLVGDPPQRLGTARGERHAGAKLTAPIVQAARARYAAGGVFVRQLAEEYGVSLGTMFDVIRRRTWRHVD